MKYVVRCPFCGNTYTVDAGGREKDTMECPSCGAQNTMQQVVDRVVDPQPQPQPRPQPNYQYHVPNNQMPRQSNHKMVLIIVIVVVVLMAGPCIVMPVLSGVIDVSSELMGAASYDPDEWKKDADVKRVLESAQEYVDAIKSKDVQKVKDVIYLPEGSYLTNDELLDMIQVIDMGTYFGDEEAEIKRIGLKKKNESFREYSFTMQDDSYIPVYFKYDKSEDKWKAAIKSNMVYDKQIKIPAGCPFYIDGAEVTVEPEAITDDYGYAYDLYTIPAMHAHTYHFAIETAWGKMTEEYECKDSDTPDIVRLESNIEFTESYKNGLVQIWNALDEIVREDGTVEDARPYFDDEIEDEKIQKVLDSLKGWYDNNGEYQSRQMEIIDIKGACANSSEIYTTRLYYRCNNFNKEGVNKTSDLCFGNITMILENDEWKIQNIRDNSMFRIENNDNNYVK